MLNDSYCIKKQMEEVTAPEKISNEITPKNILMIGPTGWKLKSHEDLRLIMLHLLKLKQLNLLKLAIGKEVDLNKGSY